MAGYPPNPGSGYPYGGAGGYGAPPPPYGSSPAPSAPPYGEKPPKEGKTSSSSAPYYGGGGGYGAPPSTQPYGSGGGYGAPPSTQRPQSYGGGYGAPPSSQPYGAPYGAPPPSSAPYGAPGGYGSPFASLVPSAFPPGTDPNVVACFQAADRDGSGMIDDKELQSALSGYSQSFSLRTVHLLMYLFTNTNVRKIGPKEFTSVFYSLQNWRSIFERFDRDRSGKIDATELRDALLSLGYSVSPTVLDLLVSKFDKTGGKNKAIEYDNFIECCLTVKGLTEKFKEKDTAFSGSATFTYEAFMLTVLPFLIA
jgi:calcium-binding protein CML